MLDGTGLIVHENIHATMREVFTPREFMPIITHPKHKLWNLPAYGYTLVPEDQREAIGRAWQHVVTTYPAAYLRYRLAVMIEVLCIEHFKPPGVIPRRSFAIPEFAYAQKVGDDWSEVQGGLTKAMSVLWRTVPIFVPWLYALIAIVVGIRGRRDRVVLALACSGLLTEASLFVLAPSIDYRYSHWLTIASLLAVVLYRAGAQPWLRAAAKTEQVDASQASAQ